MRLFVAVTDNDWFRFLRERPHLDEVNFWQPSGRNTFRALSPGEPFLFKLHAPENFIAGGGFFAHFSLITHRSAWEWFGEANGVGSLEEMRRRISRYRRAEISPFEDAMIGAVMLSRPFFFEERDWIPAPDDFHRNIVQGKGYGLDSAAGRRLWDQVAMRLHGQEVAELGIAAEHPAMWSDPTLVRRRLGQGTFRSLVTDVYSRRCAVTGERALPVLEAAHIRPVAVGGQHEVTNGLLLRSDLHRLFDRGYVSVSPSYELLVSRKLKDDFDNGEPYYPLAGQSLSLPSSVADRPSRELLEWHSDVVFRG